MKNKIKSVMFAIIALAMTVPVVASADNVGFNIPNGTGLGNGTITNIVGAIMNWILGIVGFIGIIGFAIAGILYLTAAGDEDRIGTAKKAMLYSIIGVIVALIGLVVMTAVQSMLKANSGF